MNIYQIFKESESKDLNIYFRGKNRPTKIKGYIEIFNPNNRNSNDFLIANGYYIKDIFKFTLRRKFFSFYQNNTNYIMEINKLNTDGLESSMDIKITPLK